jgi:hypothetical protein
MADVAVGRRNEFDFVPSRSPFRGHSAGFELTVVGVRAECDDA